MMLDVLPRYFAYTPLTMADIEARMAQAREAWWWDMAMWVATWE